MEFPKCQTGNHEARKFSRECGTKFLLLSPQCSSENIPDDKFCYERGHNLQAPPKPPEYSEPRSHTPNTPKFLADKILIPRSTIEGERKLVSVLFADVALYIILRRNIRKI